MLILLTLPCQEFTAYAERGRENVTFVAATGSEQHSDGQLADGCSPFCICSCCSVNSTGAHTASLFVVVPSVDVIIPRRIASYSSDHTSNYLASIWQPPKA